MDILDRREPRARALERLEHGRGGRLLTPLSAIYAAGVAIRRRVDSPTPLPPEPPSLAIGNLRVGGTGKTPVVADLGVRVAARGRRVAVLMRGYRADLGGDEPQWLRSQGLKVELGADRLASFARARAAGAELVLLDDALQSRVRARVSAAIVLDRDLIRMPRLLPAGPLREGAQALERVDFVFVRCEADAWPTLEGRFGRGTYAFRLSADSLQPLHGSGSTPLEPLLLLSGLARPESFERDALRIGLSPRLSLRLSDHAQLGASERQLLASIVRERHLAGAILPAKNAVRFGGYLHELGLSVHVLAARVQWREDPLPDLLRRLGLCV